MRKLVARFRTNRFDFIALFFGRPLRGLLNCARLGRGSLHQARRTFKYECVYLHAWETGSQARAGVRDWMEFYNHRRPHSALGGKPPAVIYWRRIEQNQPDQQVQRVA
ncbi:integrase core domain-containing protein [Nitratireductor sp. OM-1]|uniref:integrase core domain-containing protein n=1 Tax=Nitratireductor sp. OM-1 TaxID=1756988 RepID=UPI000DDFBDFF